MVTNRECQVMKDTGGRLRFPPSGKVTDRQRGIQWSQDGPDGDRVALDVESFNEFEKPAPYTGGIGPSLDVGPVADEAEGRIVVFDRG
jgi:hypothetical protein